MVHTDNFAFSEKTSVVIDGAGNGVDVTNASEFTLKMLFFSQNAVLFISNSGKSSIVVNQNGNRVDVHNTRERYSDTRNKIMKLNSLQSKDLLLSAEATTTWLLGMPTKEANKHILFKIEGTFDGLFVEQLT